MKERSGYVFNNLEGEPEDRLEKFDIPPSVALPLGIAKPLVSKGERVKAGQVIARADEKVSTPVVASIGGTVQKIARISPEAENRAVFIDGDGSDDWQKIEGFKEGSPLEKRKDEVEDLLYLGGVTAQVRGNIPTSYNSARVDPGDMCNIIIDMVEDRAYSPSLQVFMANDGLTHLIDGLQILKKIMPEVKIHIAVNNRRQELIKILASRVSEYDYIYSHPMTPAYPRGQDEMLTSTILKQKIAGNHLSRKGILIMDFQGVIQVYDAVSRGRPAFDRVIALSGTGWKHNPHLKIRLGTSLSLITDNYLDNDEKQRLVANDIMTGEEITAKNVPITSALDNIIALPDKKTRELFAFLQPGVNSVSYTRSFLSSIFPAAGKSCDTKLKGEQRPCIFCKYCQEICPVDIIPHLLDKFLTATRTEHDELIKYGLMECIECNLCSFVCPAKIPLAAHIKQGQQLIRESGDLTETTGQVEH